MRDRNLQHSDNWATPKDLYDKLNYEFSFDFDPCPLNIEAITPENDGLLKDWGKSNFVNPPYSRKLKEQFIMKAIAESLKSKLVVMLIPVSTSSKIFHEHIQPNAKEIRFLRGRVRFVGNNKYGELSSWTGMHDSMIVVFGEKQKNNIDG